jgi:hypothetical protein
MWEGIALAESRAAKDFNASYRRLIKITCRHRAQKEGSSMFQLFPLVICMCFWSCDRLIRVTWCQRHMVSSEHRPRAQSRLLLLAALLIPRGISIVNKTLLFGSIYYSPIPRWRQTRDMTTFPSGTRLKTSSTPKPRLLTRLPRQSRAAKMTTFRMTLR